MSIQNTINLWRRSVKLDNKVQAREAARTIQSEIDRYGTEVTKFLGDFEIYLIELQSRETE